MKWLLKILLVCSVLGIAEYASATEVEKVQLKTVSLGTLLDDIALNAAAGVRTFTIGPWVSVTDQNSITTDTELQGFTKILLIYDFTHSNDGTISTTCTGGSTAATATAKLTTCTTVSGTCTLNLGMTFITGTLTADDEWGVPVGIDPWPALSCVVTHGGSADANDKLTVTGWAVVE